MTVVDTSTQVDASAHFNQRKLDRCQNGVLIALFDRDTDDGELWYSSDNGAAWAQCTITGGGGTDVIAGFSNGSMFVDLDDFLHVVWKQSGTGGSRTTAAIYYARFTPNAGRTSWTMSTAQRLDTSTVFDYPDVVAFRTPGSSPTEWDVCVVASLNSTTMPAAYERVHISNAGVFTLDNLDGLSSSGGLGDLQTSTATNANHGYPSIDFNHTGDGKTVAGGTPHLYVAWNRGISASGTYGIMFRKAVYSGGSWTWNAERVLDATRWFNDATYWLNCMFDGTRAIIGGAVYDGSLGDVDLMLYERDAADTTTTTRLLLDNATNANDMRYGSMSYDSVGNVYFVGRNAGEGAGSQDLVVLTWTRATTTLSGETVLDAAVTEGHASLKRGYSNSRIELLYTDGSASPYSVTYLTAVTLNVAPNAPTLLSPVGNAVIDKDVANVFDWDFSDPDVGDSQSAYDFQYRLVGAGVWTSTGWVTSTTTSRTVTGGTLASGDYEWQVRTKDALGEPGPWSASSYFTAATTPATPTITAPTSGGTVSTDPSVVEWSAPSQTHYQVRTVADSAGSPDTGTVYQDTGSVASTSDRSRSIDFDVTGRYEHVQVRIQSAGLWSAWASHRVNVSYTPPATPTVAPVASTPNIVVTVTNPAPSGGQPALDYNELHRQQTVDGGTTWTDLEGTPDAYNRVAASVINNGVHTDRLVASGVTYRYRAKAVGANQTTTTGAWTS